MNADAPVTMGVARIHWDTAIQIKQLMVAGYPQTEAIGIVRDRLSEWGVVFTPEDIESIALVCDSVMVMPQPEGYWRRVLTEGFAPRIRRFAPEEAKPIPAWAKIGLVLGGAFILYRAASRR